MTKTHSESEYVPTYLPGMDVCPDVTVKELAEAFLKDMKLRLDKRDYNHCEITLKFVLQLFSGIKTKQFGTKALIDVRELFVEQGYTRQYCNTLTNCVRKIFKWGWLHELVPISNTYLLKSVPSFLEGQTTAPEAEPRQNVPDNVVKRTLPHLLPTVAAMVQVQHAAVMRPSEVCRMKVGDIDMEDKIWLYKPEKHKGKWRKHHRTVALGKLEQKIIAPRLVGKQPDNAVFSPKDTIKEYQAIAASKRKTKRTPSQEKRHEEAIKNSKSRVREHYDTGTYGRSIKKSIKRANQTLQKPIPHWTPYQLRHTGVTEVIKTDGIDTARAVAGQKKIDTTQMYNHADTEIAIKHAKKRSVKKTPKKTPPKTPPKTPKKKIKLKRKKKQKLTNPKSLVVLNSFVGTVEEFYETEVNRVHNSEIAIQTPTGAFLTLYKEKRRKNG